jgi:hypothetical protein
MKCPKYDSCSAPICPIYKPISEQRMLPSERVCSILLEAQKPHSEAILVERYGKDMYSAMVRASNWIAAYGTYPLRRALINAGRVGSRLQNLGYLKNSKTKKLAGCA